MLEQVAPGAFERVPAKVEGAPGHRVYLNVLQHLEGCIDRDRSDLDLYTEEDGIPESVGEVLLVNQLVLSARAIPEDIRMFRPREWTQVLVVDEVVAWALESAKVEGIELQPVDAA
jgi:hypothetical protein